ncbi:PQQ-dependent sugar dehydrogenase [Sungkyunkwania multivorans]|uniref:PQQ-dependent sugar dehydrogenase n=1 Tax=Sungkyunkwania multivorans TaxID=1173618 RepID=A0ABW3CXM9_9FLAO
MKRILYTLICLAFFACAKQQPSKLKAQSSPIQNYKLITVVDDMYIPWGMTFLPDGSMLITEKSGKLIHFKNGTKQEIQDLPEIALLGQGGLMDIELHPDYEENGWLYLSYASSEGPKNGANTAVMRAKITEGRLSDKEVLYKATPNSNRGQHFGCRLEFDNDGYLYFTIGDRGNRDENPQDITRDCGKVYRIHDDGRIPKDNPFVDSPNAKKAIFTYGNRNPQGMVKHPLTGEIWTHEHGPRGGDELNIMRKGRNYGWPVITYGINYSGTRITELTEKEGMEQPIHYWTPSIAPSGMVFVTSDKYPAWKGNLLVGSLAFQYLERLELKEDQVTYREKLFDGVGRVRNVRQGPDGYIYVAVENKGILKIVPE